MESIYMKPQMDVVRISSERLLSNSMEVGGTTDNALSKEYKDPDTLWDE